MLFSYNWLSELVDVSQYSPQELADQLSLTGLEVESIANLGQALDQVVVGQIQEIKDHEDSDRLFVTQVTTGDAVHQIVLGAQNAQQGDKVIVALPGATLPGDFEIKQAKVRGVESNGMLCSLQELGFNESVVPSKYVDGIYILPQDAPLGTGIADYLKLDDAIIELDLTPNRADALSMRGIAYEVGAVIEAKPHFDLLEIADYQNSDNTLADLDLSVEDSDLSQRYQLRLIRDLQIKESPAWLQFRLMAMGMRPINNVVDTTNYYQLLYGQPMHAFDYDKLPAKEIEVRRAKEEEALETLDGKERVLTKDDIVISSGGEAIALGGVMGGVDTEVTEETQNVLLETATFDPAKIRSTAHRLGLHSDSSNRLEKGVNLSTIDESGQQASAFMAMLGDGHVEKATKEVNQLEINEPAITVGYQDVEDVLGIQLDQEALDKIFDRLNFDVDFADETFTVTVPPRRWDISIPADIMEEIARIYGFDHLPTTLPVVPSTPGRLNKRQRLIRQTRHILEGVGLNEAISYVLLSEEDASMLAADPENYVRLRLPLSRERVILRQSLLPSFIEIVRYNQARGNQPIAFYETGKTYFGQGKKKLPREQENLAVILSGQRQESTWYQDAENFDFFDLKGIFESYFESIRLADAITYERVEDLEELHPSRAVRICLDGQAIGYLGQVHPSFAREHDVVRETYFGEVNLEALLGHERKSLKQLPIPRYPSTSRDLALLVSDQQVHEELVDVINEHGGDSLISVDLFDQYRGEGVGEGQQSLAYHLTFQSATHTLQDKEVDGFMENITQALETIDQLQIR